MFSLALKRIVNSCPATIFFSETRTLLIPKSAISAGLPPKSIAGETGGVSETPKLKSNEVALLKLSLTVILKVFKPTAKSNGSFNSCKSRGSSKAANSIESSSAPKSIGSAKAPASNGSSSAPSSKGSSNAPSSKGSSSAPNSS